MSKFVSNLIFAGIVIITFFSGCIVGWKCKERAVERKEDDEANGVRRYHGIKFIKKSEQSKEA